jgi:hypothetical protein
VTFDVTAGVTRSVTCGNPPRIKRQELPRPSGWTEGRCLRKIDSKAWTWLEGARSKPCAHEREKQPYALIFTHGNMTVHRPAHFGPAAVGRSKIRAGPRRVQLVGAGGTLGTDKVRGKVCLAR